MATIYAPDVSPAGSSTPPGHAPLSEQIESFESGPLFARPLPTNLRLGCLADARLRLKRAIPVEISFETDSVIAHTPLTGDFGQGRFFSSALRDLGHTISELFFFLESDAGNLGPDLRQVRRTLCDYVERRHA